ncbi:MAG TPA: ChbG/HpnK family deacetylase [Bradyrhizobium sp.]|uniref:ChbG/HpnK family deacetylase n=1 Tax=Bradyrhizobium sp. TaxID=376 RepID=UPI002C3B708F|nr:ChbG/HpnK family deacetylase [Bradyrhizobium sp.]HLZ03269.1 ChbG/HpnK family deacetylase [Bradyrhizobium sp.]
MNDAVSPRRIWLCADDYGISEGVNRAIRELIERGRLNATSVMMVTPAIGRDEAVRLQEVVAKAERCAIGLHVTLTAPFRPLTMHFRPLKDELFLPFPSLLAAGMLRRIDPEIIRAEVEMQLNAFRDLFGRSPDFVDGHQHVQLYPVVRDGVLAAVKEKAPNAWVRQAKRNQPLRHRLGRPKALFLDHLSTQFKRRAARAGLAHNPAFAGAYDYSRPPDFGALMGEFLAGLPEGGVVMCHPGFVDDVLESLDPLTKVREVEHAYLASEHFARLLTVNNITLGH